MSRQVRVLNNAPHCSVPVKEKYNNQKEREIERENVRLVQTPGPDGAPVSHDATPRRAAAQHGDYDLRFAGSEFARGPTVAGLPFSAAN